MGKRITYKVRGSNPFPAKIVDETVANIEAAPNDLIFVGPLPLNAMAELMYRVKKLSFALSCDYDDGGGSQTYTATITSTHGLADEFEIAERLFDWGSGNFLEAGPSNWFPNDVQIELVDPFILTDDNPYYKDENGKYWAAMRIEGQSSTNEDAGLTIDVTNEKFYSASIQVNADLVLATGTYPIKLLVDINAGGTTATARVTATEWWPYADKSGADAWNTTTGLKANGGAAG